MEEQMDE
jgi:hypothetical protein